MDYFSPHNSSQKEWEKFVEENRNLEDRILHLRTISGHLVPLEETDYELTNKNFSFKGEFNNIFQEKNLFDGAREFIEAYRELPIPPKNLWHGYGDNEFDYLKSGYFHAKKYIQTAEKNGCEFNKGNKILDYGCSGGRVMRWFYEYTKKGVEIWGCDIDSPCINWLEKELMPPFKVFTNSTMSTLPFKDNFFDLIYAGSVFTHIKELSTAWIMELTRLLKPNGIGIFTITSEDSIPALLAIAEKDIHKNKKVPQFFKDNKITKDKLQKFGMFSFNTSPKFQAVIFSNEFFANRISLLGEIIEIIPNFKGYQTAFVFKKKSDSK